MPSVSRLCEVCESPGKQREVAPPSPNPSYPAFSLDDLGASRTVKVVVIVCLTVLGTLESVVWGKALWAKTSPSPEEGSKSGD